MHKGGRRGVYLSVLYHSSSGHLLHYIKGFALISMPLHPSHSACVSCVQPYKRQHLHPCVCVCVCLSLHTLDGVPRVNMRASPTASLFFIHRFQRALVCARLCRCGAHMWDLFGRNHAGALRVWSRMLIGGG